MTSGLDNVTFQVVKNSLISRRRRDEDRAGQERLTLRCSTGRRLLVRHLRRRRQHGGPRPRHPHPPRLHAHTVRAILSVSGEVAPGDVFIHNDPYFGGSHLPDVNVVAPIYLDDKVLLGYTCVRAHWPDIGGASPGSYGATSEIYGEGLRLPRCASLHPRPPQPGHRLHHLLQCAHTLRSAVATSVPSLPPTCVAQCECRRSPRSTAWTWCWA